MDNDTPINATDVRRTESGTPDQRSTSESRRDESTSTIEALKAKVAELSQENSRHRNRAKEQEEAARRAEEARLKEQGEYKTLSEQLQTNLEDLKKQITERDAEIAKRDFEALRTKIAAKHNLAPELAVRLAGQTEAELEADAATLKKLVGEQVQIARSPGNAPGPKPAGSGQGNDVDELRNRYRASGKYAF